MCWNDEEECMKKKIIKMIEENKDVFENAFLKRYPTDVELEEAEKVLGIKIPQEYVWFLKKYGHGGFFFEYLGYGLNGKALFVDETLRKRKYGLPNTLLVIESCDEYVICIDTESGEIVSWSNYDRDGILKRAADFYEYFMECVDNAIENYD